MANYSFKPWELSIIHGDNQHYWNVPAPGSDDPAKLKKVCRLEITNSVELMPGMYDISFTISWEKALGWEGCPLLLIAKVGERGLYKWTKINLQNGGNGKMESIPTSKFKIDVPETSTDKKLYFGLCEVWTGKWKESLQIYEAKVEKV